ncbi:MAG: hypothetical protein ABW063_06110 [Caulobacter sp.]
MILTRIAVLLIATALPTVAFAQAAPPGASGGGEGGGMVGRPYTGPEVPTPRGLDGKPDLSGFWRPLRLPGVPGGNMGKDEPNFILPFSEQGKRAQIYSQNHTVDPEAVCILGGIPRHNASGLPFEILHTPKRLATLYNYNTHRWVTIDPNLKHPTRLEPTYFGTGIARWEGDTLVIETRGLRDSSHDKIWLDENGNPTSDQTVVIERWTRPNFHNITVEMTITDLKYYTRPFKFTRSWVRADKGQGVGEYACNENNLDAEHIGPGAGVIGPDGNRGFGYDEPLPAKPPGPEAYGL